MKRVLLLAALVWAPFLSVFLFAALGDTSALHVTSHVFALALLVPAVRVALLLRREGPSGVGLLLVRVLLVAVPLAILGHVLELGTAVVRLAEDGWVNRDTADIWVEGPHVWAANITVPSMMVSMLVVVALAVVTSVSRRRRLETA
ncbi:hypothetical protein [Oryzobacter terrae]|uniref:hypothetical protein n=1 Tax=Oryzobacter terrae TaxID=1620385 RepID=UPI00366F5F73